MSDATIENPLRVGLPVNKATDPCVCVIFGGTGDLSRRKLLPALYHLHISNLLPRQLRVLIYSSSDWSDDECREAMRGWVAKAAPNISTQGRIWDDFAAQIFAFQRKGDTNTSLKQLKVRIEELDKPLGAEGNYLFYLAVPPSVFGETTEQLGEVSLADSKSTGWRRIVVEKPFGTDLASAQQLNRKLLSVFHEKDIYRIDHYLGKETVQNILVFRFANEFVEPLLNAEHVDHIQITVAETLGLEGRGGYYEGVGALRDMIANHLLQMMSLICMEPPDSSDIETIRDAKVNLLKSVRPIDSDQVNDISVRGQYTKGFLMGQEVPGYREEEQVSTDSNTESYAALRLNIDNSRWRGVPIYLRTGKRLAKRVSEIGIQLKERSRIILDQPCECRIEPNLISINIQPNEGIAVRFEAKVPGFSYRVAPVRMDFRYGSAFGRTPPEAYERLLLDALMGEGSLFPRADGVEAAWSIVDPVLNSWGKNFTPMYTYSPGSWGPDAAREMIERDGRKWRRL